jgi:hypothetical protein
MHRPCSCNFAAKPIATWRTNCNSTRTNCNLTDQLQLDGPIATRCEPIATRTNWAATRREPVAITHEPIATKRLTNCNGDTTLLQLDGTNYNESDSVATGHEPIATGLLVATRREQVATRMSPVATGQKLIATTVGAFSIQNAPRCTIAKQCVYVCLYIYVYIYGTYLLETDL